MKKTHEAKDVSSLVQRVAAKAVIVGPKGKALIMREAPVATHPANTKSGRYQLPGGRLELGETFEDGLRREVFEETGLEIKIGAPLLVGEWRPMAQGVQQQIIGIFMAAKTESVQIRLSGEHDDYAWIDLAKRKAYDIIPPDCDALDAFVALQASNRSRLL